METEMPQKELPTTSKTFLGEFNKLRDKIAAKENFAFSRFSDGELFMLKGERLVLTDNQFITGERRGGGVYTEEEHKDFDPVRDIFYRNKLIEALQYRKHNYYKGLTGVADEDIAGKDSFKYQLDLCGQGDEEHLTFSNVFINNNYPKFLQEIVPLLKERPVVMVVNEKANLSSLNLDIVKDFRVGSNCIINNYNLVDEIKEWIKKNEISDTLFLFSASTLSNFIIYECFKEYDTNTYIDIGSSLSPWLGLTGWMYSRAYLQHWILKMPGKNKYGTQEDIWI